MSPPLGRPFHQGRSQVKHRDGGLAMRAARRCSHVSDTPAEAWLRKIAARHNQEGTTEMNVLLAGLAASRPAHGMATPSI
jgi:hypothetical protein